MEAEREVEEPLMQQILDRMLDELGACCEFEPKMIEGVAKLCEGGALSDADRVVDSLRASGEDRR